MVMIVMGIVGTGTELVGAVCTGLRYAGIHHRRRGLVIIDGPHLTHREGMRHAVVTEQSYPGRRTGRYGARHLGTIAHGYGSVRSIGRRRRPVGAGNHESG